MTDRPANPPIPTLDQSQANALVQSALRSPLPRFYVNSFVNVPTDPDVLTIFVSNGQATCLMNMTYQLAKAYAQALLDAVHSYEEKHGVKVPDTELGNVPPGRSQAQ
jgi:hypothetical protein